MMMMGTDARQRTAPPAGSGELILMITYEEFTSHNGLNTRMMGIARALSSRARHVEIACPVYGGRAPGTTIDFDGIRVHQIPVPDVLSRWKVPVVARATSVACLTACMVRHFQRTRVRFGWIQAEQIYPLPAACLLARKWRARVILDDPSLLGRFVDEKFGRRRLLRPLLHRAVNAFENLLFRRAQCILCSSERQAREIAGRTPGAGARVHRLCNGVDPAQFVTTANAAPGNKIFFNCSVPYYQNTAALRNLLKIFTHFEERSFHDYSAVVLVNNRAALPADIAGAMGANPRVCLLSNEKSIVPWLQGCDLVLLPYEAGHLTTAGPRLKVFEALACGKIVLSTKEGLDEIGGCIDGTNVIVCSDWRDMAEKTMSLIAEGDTARKRMIRAEARRLVEAEYSWPTLAQSYETILGA